MIFNNYTCIGRLEGHKGGSIESLSVSRDGKLLASGGEAFALCAHTVPDRTTGHDGVRIWDLGKMTVVNHPVHPTLRGPVTRVLWVSLADNSDVILCYGTARGFFVIWKLTAAKVEEMVVIRVGGGGEIMSMTWLPSDSATTRIAVGTRDRIVACWNLDSNYQLHTVFSIILDTTIPATIDLVRNTANDIRVFGLCDGWMLVLGGDKGELITKKNIGTIMAYTTVNRVEKQFVVDNAHDGFDLRDVRTGELVRKFPTGQPLRRCPKQVTFGEDGDVVVGGSDHGTLYVFDRKTGSLRQKLRHASSGYVQTVTAHTKNDGRALIVAATTGCDMSPAITIWSRRKRHLLPPAVSKTFAMLASFLLRFLVVLAAVGFMYQNTESKALVDDVIMRMKPQVSTRMYSYTAHRVVEEDVYDEFEAERAELMELTTAQLLERSKAHLNRRERGPKVIVLGNSDLDKSDSIDLNERDSVL